MEGVEDMLAVYRDAVAQYRADPTRDYILQFGVHFEFPEHHQRLVVALERMFELARDDGVPQVYAKLPLDPGESR